MQVIVPDSRAARELTELASHRHDVIEAAKALELANASEDDFQRRYLEFYAVTAYGRTYGSNVRRDLAELVPLSPGDTSLTEQLKIARNKAVAHSENDMTMTYVVADIGDSPEGSPRAERVLAHTMGLPLPTPVRKAFWVMLGRIDAALKEQVGQLKAEILEGLDSDTCRELLTSGQRVQLVASQASLWSPKNARHRYPESGVINVYLGDGLADGSEPRGQSSQASDA